MSVKLAQSGNQAAPAPPAPVAVPQPSATGDYKLFVGMLPRTVNEEQIMQIFRQYGSPKEVHVLRDSATGHGCDCFFGFLV